MFGSIFLRFFPIFLTPFPFFTTLSFFTVVLFFNGLDLDTFTVRAIWDFARVGFFAGFTIRVVRFFLTFGFSSIWESGFIFPRYTTHRMTSSIIGQLGISLIHPDCPIGWLLQYCPRSTITSCFLKFISAIVPSRTISFLCSVLQCRHGRLNIVHRISKGRFISKYLNRIYNQSRYIFAFGATEKLSVA